mmetsp:Transcript_10132/g.12184  ORF Transcript_10132/g.12184 Transcript_10132/m.12184 type:complete len:557 (+) Transcript_10132:102-1772(+)|eukprot:CAMPEP_0184038564 /NCGR_PEP_ID=MMETSP0955-20130417/47747_1 /TAXON_ID=627963 /ORGANISM="Aplanochytrium sp, Strain PBS07" /LENGTH=556 /DNA_ID=CAMNT_0026327275 /DNA_START=60 /DNA_END=1730 /DNA_ORIENTATION=+
MANRKDRVAYFYKPDIGSYYYGPGHPMKPHRLRLTHHLLLTYGMYRKMEIVRPHDATEEEMENFHSHEYVSFLKRMSPDTEQEFEKQMPKFNIGPYSDCPVFDGLYDFMSSCAGASIDAATKINHELADICVNWSGGLHHAKKGEASGFCYINDIVLCILELLKYHKRVLYIDIDIHHGDGVEEAFYTTNRVMTTSFHKYGDFFPGSGAYTDIGVKDGKYYSLNFPLKDGLDDMSFENIFKPVMQKVMESFQPGAVVMCCGADSITGDRLGCWNLSLRGHGMAVAFMKTFGIPLVLLGGGGYTPRNVARCWTYETAIALGQQDDLDETIPYNQYHNYFGPNYKLHLTPEPSMRNQNSRQYLEKYTNQLLENLKALDPAPSVQFQEVPKDFISRDRAKAAADEEADRNPDAKAFKGRRSHPAEFYADDQDNDPGLSSQDTTKVKTEEAGVGTGQESSNTDVKTETEEKEQERKEPGGGERSELKSESSPTDPAVNINTKKISIMTGDKGEDKAEGKEDDKAVQPDSEQDASTNGDILPKKRSYPAGTECGGFVPPTE